ncbi:hypothetical protein N4T20_02475 [Flavobacterium sp. TR2]|uniref:hypothetical protein n=1 Tax=Flavobacterium sp. TR2 TaxID=2977321 RepID=UPI0021B09713|nr:hypothetical protein [Flavobacterium sp. TR2]UWY28796.1 hypothetical protein N4T20_02475 [Flavobacterium sp. TR2]
MTDILLENDDLKVIDGDFVLGDSTNQNVEMILKLTPGELKEHLETGVAIDRSISGNLDRFLDRTVRVQMEADGFNISLLEIKETGLTIDGSYE